VLVELTPQKYEGTFSFSFSNITVEPASMWPHTRGQRCSPGWHTVTPACQGSHAAGWNLKEPTVHITRAQTTSETTTIEGSVGWQGGHHFQHTETMQKVRHGDYWRLLEIAGIYCTLLICRLCISSYTFPS